MVSLTLGVVLSLGVVNLFLQSKTSYYQDEETAQLQENGRWALRYVARELSMTGFMGGIIDGEAVTTTLVVADDCATGWASNTSEALEHLDNPTDTEATTTYGCLSSGEVKPGTDIIAVRRTKDTPHVSDGTVLAEPLDDALYLRVEDFGAASTLVKGSAVTGADKTAGSKVDVWQYQPQLLYIRPWSLTSGDGVPALCRKTLTTSAVAVALDEPECLVEGIENMQVEFGVDNSNPLDYVPEHYEVAPTAAELERAVTARIYLLARSINQVAGYTNDKSYTLGATTVAAADDGFYRRVLQTTIMLRNSEAFGF
jgi:hypothetical protein